MVCLQSSRLNWVRELNNYLAACLSSSQQRRPGCRWSGFTDWSARSEKKDEKKSYFQESVCQISSKAHQVYVRGVGPGHLHPPLQWGRILKQVLAFQVESIIYLISKSTSQPSLVIIKDILWPDLICSRWHRSWRGHGWFWDVATPRGCHRHLVVVEWDATRSLILNSGNL